METKVLEDISSKLTLLHEDLRELINLKQSREIDVTNIIETIKQDLKISFNVIDEQERKHDAVENQNTSNDALNAKKSIITVWKQSLNERKQNFWNFLKCQNTAVIYETWLGKENPVLPRKFRPKFIPGEHADDLFIRRENAIRNFEVEVKLLKNKASRYEAKYTVKDEEMYEIFHSKFDNDITESLENYWKSDCEREEMKSVEIWKRKQNWLETYEEKFGTDDIFISEDESSKTISRHGNRNISNAKGSGFENGSKKSVRNNEISQNNRRNPNSQIKPPVHRQHLRQQNRKPNSNRKDNSTSQLNIPPRENHRNYIHSNGTTYIGRKFQDRFLDQRGNDKGGGTINCNTTNKTTVPINTDAEETAPKIISTITDTAETSPKTIT